MSPPSYVLLPLLTVKEIEVERSKISKDFIKTSLQMTKDELDTASEVASQENLKRIKDIINPTPGLFIDDQLNPNEQNFQNTADNFFNLPPQMQQQLNKIVFKKIIKQPIIQPTPPEIIPIIVPKTEGLFIDDDYEFDSFKKPEPTTTINIGKPKDEEYDDLVMISDDDNDDDDDAKISKLLIKTDIEIKGKDRLKWKKIKPENHIKINNKT